MYNNRAVDFFGKQNEILKIIVTFFLPISVQLNNQTYTVFLYLPKAKITSFKINLSVSHAFLLTDLNLIKSYSSPITCEKPYLMFLC